LDLDGNLAAARLMLANLYLHQEKCDEAIEQLKGHLDENPFAPDRGREENGKEVGVFRDI